MGGGVMRTAAKAASLGAYRSAAAAGARRSATSTAATPAAEMAPAALALEQKPNAGVSASNMASWELDDWEFGQWKDVDGEPVPRLVFGPPPTIEEAKEATANLKDALDMVCPAREIPVDTAPEQQLHLSEDKFNHSLIITAMPGHVAQAFSLLQTSPEAQNVVASLASDEKVWEAVMKNEKVMEFYRNKQLATVLLPAESIPAESSNPPDADSSTEENPEAREKTDFMEKTKNSVLEWFKNIPGFFQGLFQDLFHGPSEEAGKSSKEEEGFAAAHPFILQSFLALAIAVIMVILFKRA